jgi:hypothetical protein
MNDELEMIWKEAIVAIFKVLSRHSPVSTEEKHENLRIAGLRAKV